EEPGVELVDIGEATARLHVGGILEHFRRLAGIEQFLIGKKSDGLDPVPEKVPEATPLSRSGEPAGHADDRQRPRREASLTLALHHSAGCHMTSAPHSGSCNLEPMSTTGEPPTQRTQDSLESYPLSPLQHGML